MDTQNDGLKKVIPLQNIAMFGIYVTFPRGTCFIAHLHF